VYRIDQSIVATVPRNAIVAFDGNCPETGWEPYAEASGRFLLGASPQYPRGDPGGEEEIQLSEENLPPFTLVGQTAGTAVNLFVLQYVPGGQDSYQQGALSTDKSPNKAVRDPVPAKPTEIPVPPTQIEVSSTEKMQGKKIQYMPRFYSVNYCRKL
jgi:hypothetical protein